MTVRRTHGGRSLVGIVALLILSISVTRVQAFTNDQSATLVIGQRDFITRATVATQRGLTTPTDVTFDSSGNLWVADTTNNRVLEFSSPFTNWENASVVLGHADFITRTSPSSRSTLSSPSGVALDSSGNLWVADKNNNRVVEFKPPFASGEDVSLIIGQKALSINQTQTRTVNQSILTSPQGVAFNSGNLWVVDSGDARILEFVPPFTNGMNASLVIGQSNFIRAEARSPTNASNLEDPSTLTFDSSGNLWVSDYVHYRVLEFKAPFSTGMSASLVLGQTSFTARVTAASRTNVQNTWGLAFDPSGSLWVADDTNNRVLFFPTPFSNGMAATLVLGQPDFTSRSTSVTPTTIAGPKGMAFDASGNLWVADSINNRVIEFTSTTVPEFPTAVLAAISLASLAVVALLTRKLSSRSTQTF